MSKRKRDMLTLTRHGSFSVLTEGEHHCGVAEHGEKLVIGYNVQVCCYADESLDRRGFLFEQRIVDDYFQKIKRVKSSCELLAMRVASDIEDIAMEENALLDIKWINVQLSAFPHKAHMTFRYHP
jgi:Xaa-Pro aminopeptidase